ncbi:MAG: DinB family protein [Gemmatimonadales bacterium]
MKAPLRLTALALCCLSATGAAPDPAAPVSDAFRSIAQRFAKNLIAAAEEMPADKYGFKPTPAQMSVGQVILHVAQGNDYLCSQIGGAAAPKRSELPAGASKATLVRRLKETFQLCDSALAKVNDSNLGTKLPYFRDSEISRAQAMFAAVEDWGGHYSQLAVYLRLNGLLPPTAKPGRS